MYKAIKIGYCGFAFTEICQKGHLEMAKWLINIGSQSDSPTNIHASDEYACENDYLETAR